MNDCSVAILDLVNLDRFGKCLASIAHKLKANGIFAPFTNLVSESIDRTGGEFARRGTGRGLGQ